MQQALQMLGGRIYGIRLVRASICDQGHAFWMVSGSMLDSRAVRMWDAVFLTREGSSVCSFFENFWST